MWWILWEVQLPVDHVAVPFNLQKRNIREHKLEYSLWISAWIFVSNEVKFVVKVLLIWSESILRKLPQPCLGLSAGFKVKGRFHSKCFFQYSLFCKHLLSVIYWKKLIICVEIQIGKCIQYLVTVVSGIRRFCRLHQFVNCFGEVLLKWSKIKSKWHNGIKVGTRPIKGSVVHFKLVKGQERWVWTDKFRHPWIQGITHNRTHAWQPYMCLF